MSGTIGFWDMPDNFWYLDLKSALEDWGISEIGIHEIQRMLPLSNPKDRERIRTMFAKLVLHGQATAEIDLTWENKQFQLRRLGLSDAAVLQIFKEMPITGSWDRLTMLDALTAWLVRNEARVPRGMPGVYRELWKRNQGKK